MSYVVVGSREGDAWRLEVAGVGRTTASELSAVEAAARDLLRREGVGDADSVDLQLLLPDFEADLSQRGVPEHGARPVELISAVIALIVVVGALAFLIGRALG